jgi:hypothetical protein
MRTTLTLEEPLAKALKKVSHQSGKSFKQVVNETLRAGLAAQRAPRTTGAYKITPAALGGPLPGINLDKALQLADFLEDAQLASKLELRK